MAKEEMDAFLDAVRGEKSLAEAFAKAVADVARDNGFDVDDQDVLDRFHAEEPATRPLPPGRGRMTTLAMGEEDGRGGMGDATTLAVGEEDDHGIDAPGDDDEGMGGATTMAIGEEGSSRPRPLPPASVTLAIGEEDRKAPPPGRVTSAALGEEDGTRRTPPAPGRVTTMALGEETRKRPPRP